jgi:hypothetical protein
MRMAMRIQRRGALRGRCLALACATLSNLALAGATDLGAPELRPVTAGAVQAAIGADGAQANRRPAPNLGDAAGLVSRLAQHGKGNRIELVQTGGSNEVLVDQHGSGNRMAARQESQFNRLDVAQQGNGNTASFSQAGGARASVSQIGDSHRADISQTLNSPAIVIRQTGIGTVVQTTQF